MIDGLVGMRGRWLRIFMVRCGFVVLAGLALSLAAGVGHAHTVRPVVVTVNLSPDNNAGIRIRLNAEVLLAGIGPEYGDTNDAPNAAEYDALRALPPDEMAARFAAFVPDFLAKARLLADGEPVPLDFARIEVPDAVDLELARDSEVFLDANIPADTAQLQWVWPEAYGSHVLRYIGPQPGQVTSVWLQPGELAAAYTLSAPESRSTVVTVLDYIRIGFEHIVPKGLDHILFVLGLFLLSMRVRPLLWQVSAFTVAHTITLGMSIYGVIDVSPSIVEPLIALSIVYVGVENCLTDKLHAWRVLLVFLFGLLHGMGFAGVLAEIGLPESEFLTALISFNVGVEAGQLAVIALAFGAVGWWRNRSWYRQRVVVPASLAIAATGLYWAIQRVM